MSELLRASGTTGPLLKGPEIDEQLRGGTQTRYTWTGSRSEIESQRAIVRANGASLISVRPAEGGEWELSATFPGLPEDEGGAEVEQPTNQHDLDVSAELVSVWQSPVLAVRLSAADIKLLKQVVKFWEDGIYNSKSDYQVPVRSTWETLQNPIARVTWDISQLGFASATNATSFFNNVVLRGTDKCYRYNSVYRRSITAATYSQVQAAYTGVGKIWTSAEVVAFEGVPTNEWFGLDATTQWLKMPPRVSAATGGKTSIEYHYQGGFSSASWFLYEAYGSATLADTPA